MLSVLWLGALAIAIIVMVHATAVVQRRAHLQHIADAVVLALASRDQHAAQLMAAHEHVAIQTVTENDNTIAVVISSSAGSASAQALRSAYEFQP